MLSLRPHILVFTLLVVSLLSAPTVLYGNDLPEFQQIVPIPDVEYDGASFGDYVNQIFQLSISVGAILAVMMMIWGGFEYMTSDVIATKGKGLDKIRNSLLGLLLLMASYLVLYIINPCLLQITVFTRASSDDACSRMEQAPSAQSSQQSTIQSTTGITDGQVTDADNWQAILSSGTVLMAPRPPGAAMPDGRHCANLIQMCAASGNQFSQRNGNTCPDGSEPLDVCLRVAE